MARAFKSLNCRGTLVDITNPVVMGIVNLTPDSFYSASRVDTEKKLLTTVESMLENGATFIDIGGMSSRPNADKISTKEELSRVVPAIEILIKHFPKILISIDTFSSEVAVQSIQHGACIVNDISAGEIDKKMIPTIAAYRNVPYIMMHMRGTPQTMQGLTDYDDIAYNVLEYFVQKVAKMREVEMVDYIIDPGFGFAKTLDQNYELLSKMHTLSILDAPILGGISRKSMIYKLLNITPEETLSATSALHMELLNQGTDILRVHDVKEACQVIGLWKKLNNIE
jgi:dihydropteroate synthase